MMAFLHFVAFILTAAVNQTFSWVCFDQILHNDLLIYNDLQWFWFRKNIYLYNIDHHNY